ncbi:MAG: extracellular solute-binding protein, partial [Oscillospiraceae bacterium]
ELDAANAKIDKMKKLYPNITVTPDNWVYTVDSFLPKASSNQLPTVYNTWFTDVQKIVDAGYAADITEYMQKNGYIDAISDQTKKMVSKDGKYYGIPTDAYAMGLFINMNLFKQAGLVNPDGTPIIPQTYEELAKTAATIKEKTGKAGMVLPTINNCGGWHFMNIAWSYGTEFIKKNGAKYESAFASEEGIKALQYVKDLKWKYNALPDNSLVDIPEMQKLFATDQAAMFFSAPSGDELISVYKMNKDNIAMGSLPAGEKGRYSLMGGNLVMLSPDATSNEIDAAFKWFELDGKSPKVSDDTKASWDSKYKLANERNLIVGIKPYEIWGDSDRAKQEDEIRKKYLNVNLDLFKEYSEFKDVQIHAEEPVCCQELYKTLDSCIQAVLTDKNADPAKLMTQAASDFQKNYLDNLE